MMSKRIAVVTSGGDAPGMNAVIRAVTRAAAGRGWKTLGIRRGYEGLLAGDHRELGPRDVGSILQTGGTILGSARSAAFREPARQKEAAATIAREAAIGMRRPTP
jgi:6-phosphofructokinase 1